MKKTLCFISEALHLSNNVWVAHINTSHTVAWPAKLILAQSHSALLLESGNPTDFVQVEVFNKQNMNFQHINNNLICIEKSYKKHAKNIVVLRIYEKVWV